MAPNLQIVQPSNRHNRYRLKLANASIGASLGHCQSSFTVADLQPTDSRTTVRPKGRLHVETASSRIDPRFINKRTAAFGAPANRLKFLVAEWFVHSRRPIG